MEHGKWHWKKSIDPKFLVEWEKKEDKDNTIIGLALWDTQLHLIDLTKSSNEIWEQLSKLFGENSMNAKFSLKLQLFSLKMHDDSPLSTHINELMSLFKKLVEIGAKVDRDDAKAILSNSLSYKYYNVVFTLSQVSSQSLDSIIVRWRKNDKFRRLSKRKMRKTKGSTKCFYCHKYGHTTWSCRTCARDLLNGKETANISNLDDLSEWDSDEKPSEPSLQLF